MHLWHQAVLHNIPVEHEYNIIIRVVPGEGEEELRGIALFPSLKRSNIQWHQTLSCWHCSASLPDKESSTFARDSLVMPVPWV
jgi:hypothetical protein